jgi:hypothetical protein
MIRYSKIGLSYTRLSSKNREFARIIYEEKERDPTKIYESIIEEHPEFGFKGSKRAGQLYFIHKNHEIALRGQATKRSNQMRDRNP